MRGLLAAATVAALVASLPGFGMMGGAAAQPAATPAAQGPKPEVQSPTLPFDGAVGSSDSGSWTLAAEPGPIGQGFAAEAPGAAGSPGEASGPGYVGSAEAGFAAGEPQQAVEQPQGQAAFPVASGQWSVVSQQALEQPPGQAATTAERGLDAGGGSSPPAQQASASVGRMPEIEPGQAPGSRPQVESHASTEPRTAGPGGAYSAAVAQGGAANRSRSATGQSTIPAGSPQGAPSGYRTATNVASAASLWGKSTTRTTSTLSVTITGRVLNGTTPLANVSPSATCMTPTGAGCGWSFAGPTATDGSFTLTGEPGRYDLYVGNFGGGFNSLATTFVDATSGTSFSGRDIQAAAATVTLSGTVADAGGAPISGARVSLDIPRQGNPGDWVEAAFATTDTGGHYALAVAPGTYRARAGKAGYRTQLLAGLALSSPTTRNFSLTLYPVTISGRVLNGTTPLPNVWPWAGCFTGGGGCSIESAGPTASDGSFTLYGEAGKYNLYLGNYGFGFNSTATTFVDATAGGSFSGRDIQVVPASTILSGTVADATTAAPLGGARVSLNIPQQGTPGWTIEVAFAIADANGLYGLQAAPSTYSLRASRVGYRSQSLSSLAISG
ncbi:MAG: carboxypeptidase regulatory-like domain-containing protein, partial [Chloroflexi bacterium]|nr:carboxypeptidase regulatory-like domain-containing protein [Chloroflexota bacterium]